MNNICLLCLRIDNSAAVKINVKRCEHYLKQTGAVLRITERGSIKSINDAEAQYLKSSFSTNFSTDLIKKLDIVMKQGAGFNILISSEY